MTLLFKTINFNKESLEFNNDMLKTYCFGQKCEDFLVNLIFQNKTEGTFLDIGAHDGVRFSNSFAFSKLGWKGICVEAHPDYFNICYKNRNNDNTKIYNIACSNKDSEGVTFFSNYRGSLSTLNPNLNEKYKKEYKNYYKDINYSGKVNNFTNGPITISSITMNTLIENNKNFLNNGIIDLITIDVDGSEEYVLGGFDILKYNPRVIIMEVSVVRNIVENYMIDKGYHLSYDNGLNVIYCRDESDKILFENELKKIKNTIIMSYDTGHPLGN